MPSAAAWAKSPHLRSWRGLQSVPSHQAQARFSRNTRSCRALNRPVGQGTPVHWFRPLMAKRSPAAYERSGFLLGIMIVIGLRDTSTTARTGWSMPFSNYRDNYDASTLAILQAAFDEAWEVLTTSGGSFDQEATRTALADLIELPSP